MIENIEVDERLDLIQNAVLKLHRDLDRHDFDEITDFIEALCRHRDLPLLAVNVPSILQAPTPSR